MKQGRLRFKCKAFQQTIIISDIIEKVSGVFY